ncbi:chemotaxis protein CheB [Undibacterium sp. MH2W]|uniref:chemotaxis protein CheB n=1 Tax=Undibacterium sp. MH2W TaxID=3413044 RepID=UPI003BF36765
MEIFVRQTEQLHRICILGAIENDQHCQTVSSAINATPINHALQIDFYDADHVDSNVLAILRDCADKRPAFKIVAYHHLLGQRLVRLNLPVLQKQVEATITHHVQCQVVAIAGSANSLDKLMYLVEQLPVTESCLFVLQHVLEDQISLLDSLLRVKTDYTVVMPHHMQTVEPGTIYVAPPGHHMRVAHGLIYLTKDKKIQFSRPSIDVLLTSLALEYGDKVTAVILCGLGNDGVVGCGALKKAGATVIVEDSSECAGADAMPDAIVEAGHSHYVFKHHVIASVMRAYLDGKTSSISDQTMNGFLHALDIQYGFNFSQYQRGSLMRRVHHLMNRFHLPSFADFQLAILSNRALFERMLAEMSVAVTQFFRHPAQFAQLRHVVLPYLASFPVVRMWSAGCATGEEAYSLSILVHELNIEKKCRLFATDINQHLLNIAVTACYPLEELAQASSNYLQTQGTGQFNNYVDIHSRYLSIKDHYKKLPAFHQHSLLNDGSFNEFQLIICRNVFIYFDTELQKKILLRFFDCLHRDGVLVLGPQDGIDVLARSVGFTPFIEGTTIYRRNNEKNNG